MGIQQPPPPLWRCNFYEPLGFPKIRVGGSLRPWITQFSPISWWLCNTLIMCSMSATWVPKHPLSRHVVVGPTVWAKTLQLPTGVGLGEGPLPGSCA